MFKTKKKQSHVSIELNDYVLRAIVMKGPSIEQASLFEMVLPQGLIEEASIKDEMELFNVFKANVSSLGGKHQSVRFFVPDPIILLKSFDHPKEVVGDKLKEFVQMEIGRSIHLPFQEPLIDVYDSNPGDGQAMLFAAAPEEVHKMTNLLLDIDLDPEVADIRALCNLRFLEMINAIEPNKTYLLANWLVNELSICIYSDGQVDFLRYQPIETDLSLWLGSRTETGDVEFSFSGDVEEYRMTLADQVLELDRIMNFFRFSLYKGEKSVDEIIVMGDNPFLEQIQQLLQENLPLPVNVVNDYVVNEHFPGYKAKHTSLLGLALKVV
ncbi:pilus assembly protein PilM [Ureibacillus massiliensis 4400831 = CIP 108448 = CCUG 49529]|uniref:Pilus assembly protein PilM n=1 Tax=Ureibacillus massiliensis 4400831 = CIP 108448 = CCUG 49529 TaxID=1211035 RepID=A0A0A3J2L7_9BACL|nr:pilus assembly protein PilM [Ureibacillus massiliensis]KGR91254.1 pilus assembly protein PilM [Ureibacillus massiliensis 4400831 = CIP 108448 = CCUG 49529]